MRLNRVLAAQPGLSRRSADAAIAAGRVSVNGQPAMIGQQVGSTDTVTLDGRPAAQPAALTIALNKPVGYVCSRRGQGAPTIYDLLPAIMPNLKPVGRLDKDSAGLLIMTNNGKLAQSLGHPSSGKRKTYEVRLNRPLTVAHRQRLADGVMLDDGPSHLAVSGKGQELTVVMTEGRNRQIRRTFTALDCEVISLLRTAIGPYQLGDLAPGQWREQP